MAQRLGFGFVGAGEIAVASATAVRDSDRAELVRTMDARHDLAADLATRFGGRPAESIEELLGDPDVQAVYISTPHHLHRDVAIAAARAGKHVFVEKPVGVGPADAQAVVQACRDAGVQCGVPFVVRYTPAYREAWRLVQAGAIGSITGFRAVYRGDKPRAYWSGGYSGRATGDWRQQWATAGGGVLIMNTIHDLDALLWITGLQVEQVSGAFRNTGSPGEVEDLALALLSCSGGALASVEAMAALPGGQGPDHPWINRVYGSEGQILLPSPWGGRGLARFTREQGTWAVSDAPRLPDARQLAFDEFAAAVLAGSPVPIPGEEAVRASTILHAVYESGRTGKQVSLT